MSDFERTEKKEASVLLRGGLGCLGMVGALLAFIMLLFVWFVANQERDDEVARRSVPVSADDRWKAPYGELVSVTGVLTAGEPLGDGLYLKPGPYLRLSRRVERYGTHEVSERDERSGTTSTRTAREWLTDDQEGLSVFPATAPRVGAFPIDALALEVATQQEELKLSKDMLLPEVKGRLVDDEYLFIGKGTPKAPELGDQRIRYEAVSLGDKVTVFAKAGEGVLVPYERGDAEHFYKARKGDREAAISDLGNIETGGRTVVVFLSAFVTSLSMLLMLWATRPFIDWPGLLGPIGQGVFFPAMVGGVLLTVLTLVVMFVTRGSALSLLFGPALFVGVVVLLVYLRRRQPVYPG